MSIELDLGPGPLIRRFIDTYESDEKLIEDPNLSGLSLAINNIMSGDGVEVYFAPETHDHDEAEFYLVTDDKVLAKIALTGELTSVHKLSRRRGKDTIDTVVDMDPKHTYHLFRKNMPVDGIIDDVSSTSEQLLERIVDYVYSKADSAQPTSTKGIHFQVLTYSALVARFNMLQAMHGSTDIIPDQTPRTIFVKAGEGCWFKCAYCQEPGKAFKVSTLDEYEQQLVQTKDALESTLGREAMENMNEGFINIADIGFLNLSPRTGLTARKAADMMRYQFPWIEKMGSFIGTQDALRLSEDERGDYELDGKTYSSRFFRELCNNGFGINRLYLGLETANTEGSYVLNKKVSYEEKMVVAKLIKEAKIGLKVIVQLGVFGKGFYPLGETPGKGKFVPWYKAQDDTIRWLNEARPYRIMPSHWQNYGSLPINGLILQGRIVHDQDPRKLRQQIIREEKRLIAGLDRSYDASIRGFNDPVVELNYHNYLWNRDSKMVQVHD